MYIDNRLFSELLYYSAGQIDRENIEDYIKENGRFYSLSEAMDDLKLTTIEEVLQRFYLIVCEDKVRFICNEIFDDWW